MSRDDSFLSRWSRRKLDGKTPARTEDDSLEPDMLPAAPAEVEPDLSPEDLAQLPRIEDLTADSEIGPFLRKGVPALLRKTALRRIWELDPGIRDYVGDARDYAYDWNVIGGVPGAGPLLPADDVGATLARMFDSKPPERAGLDVAPDTPAAAPPPQESAGAESEEALAAHRGSGPETAVLPNAAGELSAPAELAQPAPKPASARRHGGAVPV